MCRMPVARITTAATYGATCPQGSQASKCLSCTLFPSCPIWGLFVIPMAWKRHLWSTDLAPVNFKISKKFFREDFLSHALYHPTKFQPDPSSHL